MKKRLDPSTFTFPLAEIRRGYRSALYFGRSKRILESDYGPEDDNVTLQVFQKHNAILCGIDETISLLIQCIGHWSDQDKAFRVFDAYMTAKQDARRNPLDFSKAAMVMEIEHTLEELWVNTSGEVEIKALNDGDEIEPREPVLQLRGSLSQFVHLESVYLGILARGTKVATNVAKVVEAAMGWDVFFFADRFDRFENQTADGYAALKGGAKGVASDAMADWWGTTSMGTMPHALIAAFEGDTVRAAAAFNTVFPDVNLVPLVDFTNNCVEESVRCFEAFGDSLFGVRLDTSDTLIDESILGRSDYGQFKPTGVTVQLVEEVRAGLDQAGGNDVAILVSGGFDVEKILHFQEHDAPVDGYCVGSSLMRGGIDFTADVVEPVAKVGRYPKDDNYLSLVL